MRIYKQVGKQMFIKEYPFFRKYYYHYIFKRWYMTDILNTKIL